MNLRRLSISSLLGYILYLGLASCQTNTTITGGNNSHDETHMDTTKAALIALTVTLVVCAVGIIVGYYVYKKWKKQKATKVEEPQQQPQQKGALTYTDSHHYETMNATALSGFGQWKNDNEKGNTKIDMENKKKKKKKEKTIKEKLKRVGTPKKKKGFFDLTFIVGGTKNNDDNIGVGIKSIATIDLAEDLNVYTELDDVPDSKNSCI